MHIAMFTSGYYPVNNKSIKATEYFVYGLSNRLKEEDCKVTLFSHADSDKKFNVIYPKQKINVKNSSLTLHEYDMYLTANLSDFIVWCNKNDVRILHDHTNTLFYTLSRFCKMPTVSTMHGLKNERNLSEYYSKNNYTFNIAPSYYLKEKTEHLKIDKVIHHGIDLNLFNYNDSPNDTFLHMGRIIPEKGQIDAIEAADISKKKLTLAGYKPKYFHDSSYYDEVVKKAEKSKYVEYIGKVARKDVSRTMAKAKALIMPIKYDEAFGLVMLEAMASGTPVIAYNRASASEVVVDGVTGYLVDPDSPEALAEAMNEIDKIDRKRCREHVEKNFSIEKMVGEYLNVYREIIDQSKKQIRK